MVFFDFNIPYTDSEKPNSIEKSTRLKLIIKSMELGYTGIAYNRWIKGVMSESDRCSISLFPLSSLLRVSPSLSANVNFHRNLLGIPKSTPFRQYTRLTVVVDSPAQSSALNSGNPILKTYDVVAVKPVNQNAFEQACRVAEVDLIAIDFSEKLPFRLKQPLVKAATERGLYFEITYSSLLMDPQARRQMISSAKMLVDWTRGKNLIFSSGAPSVTELRGPYDVANLMTLLGITMERAKEAISKNCRSVITNSIKKKKFYKEAIRVDLISSTEQCGSDYPEFDKWLNWDPISSGEGDLSLDEMAKSFNASSKEVNKVKAIDFASVIDSLPSHGLQIKDLAPVTNFNSEPLYSGNNSSAAKNTLDPVAVPIAPKMSDGVDFLSEAHHALTKDQSPDSTVSEKLPAEGVKGFTNHGHELDSVYLQTCTSICEKPVTLPDDTLNGQDMQPESDMPICQTLFPGETARVDGHRNEEEFTTVTNTLADIQTSTMSVDHNLFTLEDEKSKQSSSLDLVSHTQDIVMEGISHEENFKVKSGDTVETLIFSKEYSSACTNKECLKLDNINALLATSDELSITPVAIDSKYKSELCSDDSFLHECTMKREHHTRTTGDAVSVMDELPVLEPNETSLANYEPVEETHMEEQKQIKNQSGIKHPIVDSSQLGTRKVKRKTSRYTRLLPFRRLLNPMPFKKKARMYKRKIVTRDGRFWGQHT